MRILRKRLTYFPPKKKREKASEIIYLGNGTSKNQSHTSSSDPSTNSLLRFTRSRSSMRCEEEREKERRHEKKQSAPDSLPVLLSRRRTLPLPPPSPRALAGSSLRTRIEDNATQKMVVGVAAAAGAAEINSEEIAARKSPCISRLIADGGGGRGGEGRPHTAATH